MLIIGNHLEVVTNHILINKLFLIRVNQMNMRHEPCVYSEVCAYLAYLKNLHLYRSLPTLNIK